MLVDLVDDDGVRTSFPAKLFHQSDVLFRLDMVVVHHEEQVIGQEERALRRLAMSFIR